MQPSSLETSIPLYRLFTDNHFTLCYLVFCQSITSQRAKSHASVASAKLSGHLGQVPRKNLTITHISKLKVHADVYVLYIIDDILSSWLKHGECFRSMLT